MENIKKLWNYCFVVSAATGMFWVAETIYFLTADGWHIKPICTAEKYCDNVVIVGLWISVFLFVSTVSRIINKIVESQPNPLLTEAVELLKRSKRHLPNLLFYEVGAFLSKIKSV